MPRVDGREFAYTRAGVAAARRARRRKRRTRFDQADRRPKPMGEREDAPHRERDIRSRFRGRSSEQLRGRLGELKRGAPQEGDRRRKAILAVLRNRSLRDQFGPDWRQQAFGDIEGFEPKLGQRIRALEGRVGAEDQPADPARLEALRAALGQVRERRQSFRPGRRFDPEKRTFVGRKRRRRRPGPTEGRPVVGRPKPPLPQSHNPLLR